MHDQGEPHEPMMLGTCVSGPIKELWLGGFKVAHVLPGLAAYSLS